MGKTHLAVVLALKAVGHGYGAYFVRAYDLTEDLRRAQAEQNLGRCMRVYLAPTILVIDEFHIWPYDRDAATRLLHAGLSTLGTREHHPDLGTRASANGADCWMTPSSPRPSWTGCSTTATSSTSGERATGSGRSVRRVLFSSHRLLSPSSEEAANNYSR